MYNPLDNVPLNTKRQFVMATTKDGCEVYMPCDSFDLGEKNEAKRRLQQQLDSQYIEPSPIIA